MLSAASAATFGGRDPGRRRDPRSRGRPARSRRVARVHPGRCPARPGPGRTTLPGRPRRSRGGLDLRRRAQRTDAVDVPRRGGPADDRLRRRRPGVDRAGQFRARLDGRRVRPAGQPAVGRRHARPGRRAGRGGAADGRRARADDGRADRLAADAPAGDLRGDRRPGPRPVAPSDAPPDDPLDGRSVHRVRGPRHPRRHLAASRHGAGTRGVGRRRDRSDRAGHACLQPDPDRGRGRRGHRGPAVPRPRLATERGADRPPWRRRAVARLRRRGHRSRRRPGLGQPAPSPRRSWPADRRRHRLPGRAAGRSSPTRSCGATRPRPRPSTPIGSTVSGSAASSSTCLPPTSSWPAGVGGACRGRRIGGRSGGWSASGGGWQTGCPTGSLGP